MSSQGDKRQPPMYGNCNSEGRQELCRQEGNQGVQEGPPGGSHVSVETQLGLGWIWDGEDFAVKETEFEEVLK